MKQVWLGTTRPLVLKGHLLVAMLTAHCSAKPSHDIEIEGCLSNTLNIGCDFAIYDVFDLIIKMKIEPQNIVREKDILKIANQSC